MTRADDDPDQAAADLERLQEEARKAGALQEEAEFREERLVAEIDAAYARGDEALTAALKAQHAQAEIDLENATADFESVMSQVGSAQQFWYGEDDDTADDDDD
ncbi:hypothetical protein RWH44_12285 [Microbacterium sp. KSW2-29]|uniref:Uncharacterized protein n=1 Tax=Microbacterium phycohabitans TaxID=3075993 RepID=A0ABU3SNQ0_9MICO|nr:hypothetical protein [Microbacterium sp. KSW2-29]MDU0346475.1 hypothetical protein [Microbacterium sp. KSW2-29]